MSHKQPEPKTENQTKRQSVTLTARDLADLAMIRNSPEALHAVGATGDMSEAALLHALVSRGIQHAREAAELAGYAALAADPEEQVIEGALRADRRRREAWGLE